MFKIAYSYITYLIRSSNQHGVHSPFVYQFVTQCIYNKKDNKDGQLLKKIKQSLLSNKSTIKVTDFGAGSRVFKSDYREIQKIAQTAGISTKRSKLLNRIIRYFKPHKILEIGTSLGLASSAMALGNPESQITSIEGCPETSRIAQETFNYFNINNITTVVSNFDDYIDHIDKNEKLDFIYFDGNHSKKATLSYFHKLLPTTKNNSIWIFDDIHWSQGMEEAWLEIVANPNVTVSIDTFQWGIVFFRKEQEKEHFTIRI